MKVFFHLLPKIQCQSMFLDILVKNCNFFQLWPDAKSSCAILYKFFLPALLEGMFRYKMNANVPCYSLLIIFYLKNNNFWPEIAIFSTLTLFKFQLCKFVQVFSSHLTSGHVKVQNVCKNSLLLSACHF